MLYIHVCTNKHHWLYTLTPDQGNIAQHTKHLVRILGEDNEIELCVNSGLSND